MSRHLLLACAAVSLLAASAVARAQSPPPVDLAAADKLFDTQSFGAALISYQKLLADGSVPAERRDEVQYRVCMALGKSEKWDRALSASIDFVRTHRGTIWEPRGLCWLGRLYMAVPHRAERRNGQITREPGPSDDADRMIRRESDPAPPEAINLLSQDTANARDAFEAARVLYPRFRTEHRTERDEIQLDFDLAQVLSGYFLDGWTLNAKWRDLPGSAWRVAPRAAYSLAWPVPKKLEYLYDNALALSGRDTHSVALALLAKAVWLHNYHPMMVRGVTAGDEAHLGKPVHYPYDGDQPEPYLRRLLRDFPRDPVRAQAAVALAVRLEAVGRLGEALVVLQSVLPDSTGDPWTDEAQRHIEAIGSASLRVWQETWRAGATTRRMWMDTRNVSSVHFTAYRIPLQDAFEKAATKEPLTGLEQLVPDLPSRSDTLGKPIAEWDEDTGDTGDHLARSRQVNLPLRAPGAYYVEAAVPGERSANIVLVSDLVLVQKRHRTGILFYAAHARSGKPMAGVRISVRRSSFHGKERRLSMLRFTTDPNGLADMPLVYREDEERSEAVVLARVGDHYAAIGAGPAAGDLPTDWQYIAHLHTDRPIYRPGQIVHLRGVVLRRVGAEPKPAVGVGLRLAVRDSHGADALSVQVKTDRFGCVQADWRAPADTPLGECSATLLQVFRGDDEASIAQAGFSLEEYKKPEFAVTVTPSAAQIRVGESSSATVVARYYHGGPVAGARVSYRVWRSRVAELQDVPTADDLRAGRWRPKNPEGGYFRNEVAAQGETRTDAKGAATVTFTAAVGDSTGEGSDLRFTVEAEVRDASRRAVVGTGSVTAMRHRCRLYAQVRHGYAVLGQPSEMQVVTLDAAGRPVAASGMLRIFEGSAPMARGKPAGRPMMSRPWHTGSDGVADVPWTAPRATRYEAVVTVADLDGKELRDTREVLVFSPTMSLGDDRAHRLVLAFADRAGDEGGATRVLLAAARPGSYVLLTREVGGDITERRVVRIPQRAVVLDLPLTVRDVPALHIAATLVEDGEVRSVDASLQVRRVSGLASLSVEPERTLYRPGERARLRLTARDHLGAPLRASVSVSVWDASLAAIRAAADPPIGDMFDRDASWWGVDQTDSRRAEWLAAEAGRSSASEDDRHLHWTDPPGMGLLADWPGANWLVALPFASGGFRTAFRALSEDEARWASARVTSNAVAFAPPSGMGGMAVSSAGAARINYDVDNTIIVNGAEDEVEDLRRVITLLDTAPRVRKAFADSAFWTPSVVTGEDGAATVEFDWPDNLTEWQATAVGVSEDGQVGQAEATATTSKDLLVRLQTPRFLVDRDEVVLSANVHNYLPTSARCKVELAVEGAAELAQGDAAVREVGVAAGGEVRVDWQARVTRPGVVTARVSARSPQASDAMEMSIPVVVHGVERAAVASGELRGGGQAHATIQLPKERRAGSAQVVVQLDPSVASVALGALPYLAGYPYGCMEQTMSRFVPAVVAAKALKDAGYSLEDVAKRTGPANAQPPAARSAEFPSPYAASASAPPLPRADNPVHDSARLAEMIADGLRRANMWQHSDGSWGWWVNDLADPRMTNYVLYSLLTARDVGIEVNGQTLSSGLDWLRKKAPKETDLSQLAYEARVLAMDEDSRQVARPIAGKLFNERAKLGAHARALLAIALHLLGENEKATLVLRNLESTARVDEAEGMAHWAADGGASWSWSSTDVEAGAAILQAYALVDPHGRLAPMLARWLVRSRVGSAWSSTLDTAMAVQALVAYSKASGELAPDYSATVSVGGRARREFVVNRQTALTFDNRLVVSDDALQTGEQNLTVAMRGTGTLYWNAVTRYFSEEEPITHASAGIEVTRRYFRLVPGTASTPTPSPSIEERPNPFLAGKYDALDVHAEVEHWVGEEAGAQYDRVALQDGGTVASGDVIEVELELRAGADTAYVLIEDIKPAGGEPVELRSGERGALDLWSNMELRDQKVAFFVDRLPQGIHTLSYRMRAVTPGSFHVLPAACAAMYSPDIRALSDEMRLNIRDAK